jgi:ribosome hibernation promoting factor
MRITVSGRHTEIPDRLKTYTEDKASKLERYYDRVQTVEVVFAQEANHHSCEIIATADHHTTFVAKEQHADAFAALDASVRDLERQLSRHKERFRNRKHPDGPVPKSLLAGSPETGPVEEDEE